MYVGALDAVSNQEDWDIIPGFVDDDTGEDIDLTNAAIVFEVRDPNTRGVVLSATTGNQKISIIALGVFKVSFTRAEMQTLKAKTYDIGCILTLNGKTIQLMVATVPVVDGVVSQ